jgi:hypothetical protein
VKNTKGASFSSIRFDLVSADFCFPHLVRAATAILPEEPFSGLCVHSWSRFLAPPVSVPLRRCLILTVLVVFTHRISAARIPVPSSGSHHRSLHQGLSLAARSSSTHFQLHASQGTAHFHSCRRSDSRSQPLAVTRSM